MSSEPYQDSHSEPVAPPPAPAAPPRDGLARPLLYGTALLAVVATITSIALWQRLSAVQEQLARQSADSGAQAIEARTMARQAQDTAQEGAARIGVMDARLSEVALQRSQLEELMQSLSRSRDDNLVVDIESGLRLAQQQADLTGSAEPLLAALRSADQRIARAAQPRLAPIQRALAHDIERVRSASVTDVPGLLARLDDMVRLVDELPLQNAVAQVQNGRRSVTPVRVGSEAPDEVERPWWRRTLDSAWDGVRDELRGLVRVSHIDRPEAVLLAPEQSFFLRENLKLKLVNARLGVLARQDQAAKTDLAAAANALNRYFDPSARRVQVAADLLKQAQAQINGTALPRPEETLTALATAAAGR